MLRRSDEIAWDLFSITMLSLDADLLAQVLI